MKPCLRSLLQSQGEYNKISDNGEIGRPGGRLGRVRFNDESEAAVNEQIK